jgi:hypothetical protein
VAVVRGCCCWAGGLDDEPPMPIMLPSVELPCCCVCCCCDDTGAVLLVAWRPVSVVPARAPDVVEAVSCVLVVNISRQGHAK